MDPPSNRRPDGSEETAATEPLDPLAATAPPDPSEPSTPAPRRRMAVNTLIFSVATGLSRVAGLVREIVAASYFGTTGAASAFTLAFQIPNLVRALVADAALSSAFVPVFSELLEQRKHREAYALASALAGLLLVVLGIVTLLFIAFAPVIIPPFTGSEFTHALDTLTIGLSRVLFPIVVLLGLNGLVVGVLNANDHFAIPAIAPLVWNLVIIAGLVLLTPLFHGDDRLYGYALGVVAGTLVQLLMCLPVLRRVGFPLRFSMHWRDPRIRRVLLLMLPVSLSLGLINIDLLINSVLGSLVSDQAPRAIDAAFRIYMLPQGMFSVAVATVVFPALSRLAARRDYAALGAMVGSGTRQIAMLLIPSAVATAVLATPIVRLVYQRGEFDAESTRLTAQALFWFSFSLPFAGINLLQTRSFFSLQKPWLPTATALGSLVVNAAVSLALYKPLGIAGIVLGTAVASAAMTLLQGTLLRRELGGIDLARTTSAVMKILVAAAVLGAIAYLVHRGLDSLLGRSLIAQIVSVGVALTAGAAVYGVIVLKAGIPEARQIVDLFARRLRRGRS
ncbi:MAG TPA: murein biosynthesis integral membrane protein MurJ [Solirubrobacteraceae bacterium]|nr:murein biosynthesis integral membrane protein MurJ [Solirubrobacteraceae bacterium]